MVDINDEEIAFFIDAWAEGLTPEEDAVIANRALNRFLKEYTRSPDVAEEDDYMTLVHFVLEELKMMFAKRTLDDLRGEGLIIPNGTDDDGFYTYEITEKGRVALAVE